MEQLIRTELNSRTKKYRWFNVVNKTKDCDTFLIDCKKMYDEFNIKKNKYNTLDEQYKILLEFNTLLLEYTCTQLYLNIPLEEKVKNKNTFNNLNELKKYTNGLIDLNPGFFKSIYIYLRHIFNKSIFTIVIKY